MAREIPFSGHLVKGGNDPETGIDADLLSGVVEEDNLPTDLVKDADLVGRLLPGITAQFSVSDNGDLILYVHGTGWTRSGIDGDGGLQVRFDDTDDRLVVGIDVRSKLAEVLATYVEGGWSTDDAGQTVAVATNTDPPAATPKHTASQILALTGWAANRQRTGFASGPARLPMRIPIDQKASVAAGRIRVAYGDFGAGDALAIVGVVVTEDDHVTDSGNYAYYSVQVEGIGRSEYVRVESFEPFRFNDDFLKVLNDEDRQLLDSFTVGVWEDTVAAEMTGASTTPYGGPGQNYIAQPSLAYAASQSISSQAQGWNVAVRIPLAQKSTPERYRLEVEIAGRDTTYQPILESQHVVDAGGWAYYNVHFRTTGVAVALQMQALSAHHINPKNIQINVTELHDTPDSYTGQARNVLRVSPAENGMVFDRALRNLRGGSAAVSITDDTQGAAVGAIDKVIDIDQTAFDVLQINSAQTSALNQSFHNTGSAGSYTLNKIVPTQAFPIHENNLIEIKVEIGGATIPLSVPSAFLRDKASIASKAGALASGDETVEFPLGWDSSGNRRVLHLFRYSDNTLGLAGELLTTAGVRTVISGSSPPTAFTADYEIYEVGGVPASPSEQVQGHGDVIREFWGDYAVGVTPVPAPTFDGVVFSNLGSLRPGTEVGTPAVGMARWYVNLRAYYNPGTGSDWSVTATVRSADRVRFSTSDDPTQVAGWLTSPPAGHGNYYISYYIGGGIWSLPRLVVGASEGYEAVGTASWHPESRNSQIWFDLPNWERFDGLEGFRVELTLWNSFRDAKLDSAIFDFPVESMVAQARGSTLSIPNEATVYGSAGLVHLERYGDHFGVISSLRTQDRGTDYSRGGLNWVVEYNSSLSGRTAFGFDRIRVFYPASYAPANALRYGLKISIKRRS